MTPSLGGFLTPINPLVSAINLNGITQVSSFFTPTKRTELVNKITGRGLRIESRFTRCQHLVNPMLVSIELTFINESNEPITNIRIGNKNLPSGMMIHDFSPITILQPNMTLSSIIGINYNDSTQPANFNIEYTIGDENYAPSVQLKATIGEIIRAVQLPENMFTAEKDKLKGMNEHTTKIIFNGNKKELSEKIIEAANLGIVSNENDLIR